MLEWFVSLVRLYTMVFMRETNEYKWTNLSALCFRVCCFRDWDGRVFFTRNRALHEGNKNEQNRRMRSGFSEPYINEIQ